MGDARKVASVAMKNMVKSKKKAILGAQRERKKEGHFATLMDICHLDNAKLEPKYQKFQGRIMFRGDIVKHDSGAHTVFTKQGPSASQMTAEKVMDVIARPLDCAGQVADAVSAHTQVKM